MNGRLLGGLILGMALLANALVAQEKKDEGPPPWPILKPAADQKPLPGTKPLTLEGDISRQLHDGVDKFLDAQIAASVEKRAKHWKRDLSSAEAYVKSVAPNRERLGKMLGLDRDPRPDPAKSYFEYYSLQKTQLAVAEGLAVYLVRWKAFGDVHGEGLLIEPEGDENPIVADVIAIPDASMPPEFISGLMRSYGLEPARAGCRVLIPTLINRGENIPGLTNREWLHRPAFELGRHLLGYEVQKVLAGVDCFLNTQGDDKRKIGVIGWGEGGLLAMYAAAVDPRIDAAAVAGYFGKRESLWKEFSEHNVFGLLREFGDAEIASLIAPRPLLLVRDSPPLDGFSLDDNDEPTRFAERPDRKGKPGKHVGGLGFEEEVQRLLSMVPEGGRAAIVSKTEGELPDHLNEFRKFLTEAPIPETAKSEEFQFKKVYADPPGFNHIAERHASQMAEIDRHNQWALIQSRQDRAELFDSIVKTDSLDAFNGSIEKYRDLFRTEVIGEFDAEKLPLNPRTRKFQEGPKTISYEVVLDVFPDVIAYGVLTLPKDFDITSGEKRPVVVCQHGLEGTPQDTVGEDGHRAYKAFATRLAERGFITFSPQNLYKYHDIFRIQQFKAQSIGCTLFSVIVPSHQQITDWLAAQSFVDPERIGFYGLSYGGKSAMRIPPLVDNYCLSICSADFNEWVWKNAATDPKSLRYSYANKGEYEIFEWNLGGTFNYAEMAALICPRPFMVERGHFDGVAPDETVAYEFAKVRHLYQAKLGLGDRAEIEWFVGPHTINGVGSFKFLHKHLDWPEPKR